MEEPILEIQNEINKWYMENKRSLPWRNTREPYIIWVSEIILQQTRIQQGLPYFERFIRRFPDIKSLAEADEQEVLLQWQGLGYYSRARNMHFTARELVRKYKGRFPKKHKEILELKGIGPYTAALISSVCFNKPFPVLDGNVCRVMARLFGIHGDSNSRTFKNTALNFAQKLIDKQNPGDFNQAMMDFGAMVCSPAQPLCKICPLTSYCYALKNNLIGELPETGRKNQLVNRYFHYFLVVKNEYVMLRKRSGKGIWKSLFELPMIETQKAIKPSAEEIRALLDVEIFKCKELKKVKHILSHQLLHVTFVELILKAEKITEGELFWVKKNELNKYPFPRPLEKFLIGQGFLKTESK